MLKSLKFNFQKQTFSFLTSGDKLKKKQSSKISQEMNSYSPTYPYSLDNLKSGVTIWIDAPKILQTRIVI